MNDSCCPEQSRRIYLKHFFSFYAPDIDTTILQQALLKGNQIQSTNLISNLDEDDQKQIKAYLEYSDIKKILNNKFKPIDQDLKNEVQQLFQGISSRCDIEYLKLKILNGGYQQQVKHLEDILNKKQYTIVTNRIKEIQTQKKQTQNQFQKYMQYFKHLKFKKEQDKQIIKSKLERVIQTVLDANEKDQKRICSELETILNMKNFLLFEKCLSSLKQRRQQQIKQLAKQRQEQQMKSNCQISNTIKLLSSSGSQSNQVLRISSLKQSILDVSRIPSAIFPQYSVLDYNQLDLTTHMTIFLKKIQYFLQIPVQNSFRNILFPNFYNYERQQQQKRKKPFSINNDTYNYQLDEEYFERFADHKMKRIKRSQAFQLNDLTKQFLKYFQASHLTAPKLMFFVYKLSIFQQSIKKQVTSQILNHKRKNQRSQADFKSKVLQGISTIKIENFIYQLIYYNYLKCSQGVSGSNSQDFASFLDGNYQILDEESKLIFRYYEIVLNNQIPFNMLSENSSTFGNIYAKKAMDKMKVILKDKKLFIISIIGTQSSAKSSLLNKLFQLGFKVSGGRCTVGINMILLNNKDKISIVIIDSQGTSSREREDNNFDIRINTFVMLISDVLIINIKGQLNRDQTQLINNCSFILSQLNKDKSKDQETQGIFFRKPKRVVFALRDINDLSEQNLQVQRLSIIRYVEASPNRLRQEIAISASQKDIFIFPNSKQKSGKFDQRVIQMRNSILQQLDEGKYSTLLDFYTDSQKAWNILSNLSADKLHRYKYEYMKRMKEQIKSQARKLQQQIIRKDCKEINDIYECLHRYHDIQIIEQNERMLYDGLRLTIKEKGNRRWIEIEKDSLQKVEGVNMKQFTPILKLSFDSQMLNIQLKQEYRLKKQLQNYKKYKRRQVYVQKLKLQVKGKINEGFDSTSIIKYLDQKYKIQSLRKQQQIKKLQSISKDLHQQFNIKKIEYSDVLHVKKKYYFLRQQIKKAISKLQSSQTEIRAPQQIEELQQIYNSLTKNAFSENYIKQNLLIPPNNNKTIYQTKSLDNKDIIYYIIDFLNTGTRIMEKIIDQFSFVDQSKDLSEFLNFIYQKLSLHYEQLRVKLQYSYDMELQATESAIFEVQGIKLAAKTKYLKILYSILPLKILLKTLRQQCQNIRFQIISMQNIHSTAKQQLSYLDNKQFMLCKYWFKHFVKMIVKKSIKNAKVRIDKVINKSFITPQKIIMDIYLSKIVEYDPTVPHDKLEYLQLYKLFINFDRYMAEWYHRTIFERAIIQKIYRIMEDEKAKIMEEIEIFKLKVIRTYQTLNSPQNEMRQKPIEYFYELLFNNRTLFFPNFISTTAKEIFSFFKVQITLKQLQMVRIYQKQIIRYQKKLEDYYEQQLKTKIYPIIIGCPQKCPKCGAKCKLRSLHTGPHEVIQGMHYLYCFNPQNNRQKKQCDKSWCCNVGFSSLQRQYKFDNYYDPVMGWYKCFYHGGNFSQQSDQVNILKHIWAHIGPVILEITKSKGFIDKQLKGLAKKPLKMSDLKDNNLMDYHQDYFKKNILRI